MPGRNGYDGGPVRSVLLFTDDHIPIYTSIYNGVDCPLMRSSLFLSQYQRLLLINFYSSEPSI